MSEILIYAKPGVRFERDADQTSGYTTIFVHLSRKEALGLIESLAHQLLTGNPNSERQELIGSGNFNGPCYFSVAVHEDNHE